MMRKSHLVLAACAALTVSVFAASSNVQKSKVTVGDFAVRVTKALGNPVADQRAAVESLKSLGVKVDDVNASLTEGMAARILADLGVRVSTTSPDNRVTKGKADQLVAVVGLAGSTSSGLAATDLPVACLDNRNRGICVECCKAALGCVDQSAPCDFASACAKFCKQVLPPGQESPSDPTP
ncbi:MAG: hypothetical protein HYS34_04810 [Acidobacteria bacterium]|nr:hypothetical protein [Acidobacteriota bacterium]